MKKILLISTGGTIASVRGETGLRPGMEGREILQFVPEIEENFEVDILPLMSLDSTNIRPNNWVQMAAAIEDHYYEYDGFVLLHGTDTMAYSAAALSYLCQGLSKPVVLTGAQQPIDRSISDGRLNLLNSFQYAGSDKAKGVVIVFDGNVIAGTRARKTRSKSYNAFQSIDFPEIAAIRNGRVVSFIKSEKPDGAPRFWQKMEGRIFPLKLIPGLDADIFDSLYANYDAVIMESFGVGGIPEYQIEGKEYPDEFGEAIERWTKAGKIMVVTTQVPHEGSDMAVYRVGLRIKEKYSVIEAYDMTYEAIVTKLMWIMGITRDPQKIRELFYQPVNYDLVGY